MITISLSIVSIQNQAPYYKNYPANFSQPSNGAFQNRYSQKYLTKFSHATCHF